MFFLLFQKVHLSVASEFPGLVKMKKKKKRKLSFHLFWPFNFLHMDFNGQFLYLSNLLKL